MISLLPTVFPGVSAHRPATAWQNRKTPVQNGSAFLLFGTGEKKKSAWVPDVLSTLWNKAERDYIGDGDVYLQRQREKAQQLKENVHAHPFATLSDKTQASTCRNDVERVAKQVGSHLKGDRSFAFFLWRAFRHGIDCVSPAVGTLLSAPIFDFDLADALGNVACRLRYRHATPESLKKYQNAEKELVAMILKDGKPLDYRFNETGEMKAPKWMTTGLTRDEIGFLHNLRTKYRLLQRHLNKFNNNPSAKAQQYKRWNIEEKDQAIWTGIVEKFIRSIEGNEQEQKVWNGLTCKPLHSRKMEKDRPGSGDVIRKPLPLKIRKKMLNSLLMPLLLKNQELWSKVVSSFQKQNPSLKRCLTEKGAEINRVRSENTQRIDV